MLYIVTTCTITYEIIRFFTQYNRNQFIKNENIQSFSSLSIGSSSIDISDLVGDPYEDMYRYKRDFMNQDDTIEKTAKVYLSKVINLTDSSTYSANAWQTVVLVAGILGISVDGLIAVDGAFITVADIGYEFYKACNLEYDTIELGWRKQTKIDDEVYATFYKKEKRKYIINVSDGKYEFTTIDSRQDANYDSNFWVAQKGIDNWLEEHMWD